MNAHSRSAPGAENDGRLLDTRKGRWYPRVVKKPQQDKGFAVRCTPEVLELAHRVAAAEGLSLSAWVRRAILQSAKGLP